jgi:hypothetical protein
MRVLCCSTDGCEIEGEVVGGQFFDPGTGSYDLDGRFTVRCDDGARFKVNGWAVEVDPPCTMTQPTQRALHLPMRER